MYESSPQLIVRFLDILFERHPILRAMCGHSPAERDLRELQVTSGILAVLDGLDDRTWLERNLALRGARHAFYGIEDEMYAWIGESFLAALAEAAGPAWNARLEKLWIETLCNVQSMMLAGAAYSRRDGANDARAGIKVVATPGGAGADGQRAAVGT